MSRIGVLLSNHKLPFFLCFLTTISTDLAPLSPLARRQSYESAADISYVESPGVGRHLSWRGPLGLALILLWPSITDPWFVISDTWYLIHGVCFLISDLWSVVCGHSQTVLWSKKPLVVVIIPLHPMMKTDVLEISYVVSCLTKLGFVHF